MLEYLSEIDTQLFYFFNVTVQNSLFDWLMPFITERLHWFPVWGIIIVMLIWKGGRQGRTLLVLVIPLIFLSDQLSSSVFKPLFARTRPCIALDNIHLLIKKTNSFSLPSSHAANFFAVATFFGYFYRKYLWLFLIIAAAVAYSRVYVGVHYPFDILAGALLGSACAFVIIYSYKGAILVYSKHRNKIKKIL
ncbi:phosphatase PAP2 family protein [Calditrichota bacterium]